MHLSNNINGNDIGYFYLLKKCINIFNLYSDNNSREVWIWECGGPSPHPL